MNRFFNHFFTFPRTFRQWLTELVGGVILALAVFLLIGFLSPPLPFYSPTCATGRNDPFELIASLFFMWMSWGWRRLRQK